MPKQNTPGKRTHDDYYGADNHTLLEDRIQSSNLAKEIMELAEINAKEARIKDYFWEKLEFLLQQQNKIAGTASSPENKFWSKRKTQVFLKTLMPYGKYAKKGYSVKDVLQEDPDYLYFLLEDKDIFKKELKQCLESVKHHGLAPVGDNVKEVIDKEDFDFESGDFDEFNNFDEE